MQNKKCVVYLYINKKYHTAISGCGRFLKHIGEYFLSQVLSEPTREGALLDLLFENWDGLCGTGDGPRHSDCEIVELKISAVKTEKVSRVNMLDFTRANMVLVSSVPWESGLEVHESWSLLENYILNRELLVEVGLEEKIRPPEAGQI